MSFKDLIKSFYYRQLKQRIAFTHRKIDALVYKLYGLGEEDIKLWKEMVETIRVITLQH